MFRYFPDRVPILYLANQRIVVEPAMQVLDLQHHAPGHWVLPAFEFGTLNSRHREDFVPVLAGGLTTAGTAPEQRDEPILLVATIDSFRNLRLRRKDRRKFHVRHSQRDGDRELQSPRLP
jgi:hypothetical protein